MAVQVATAESDLLMQQSKLLYPETRTDWGVVAGEQERSYCIFQIHAPVHDATAKKLGLENYKTDVEQCIKMARVIYDDRGNFGAWTEWHKIIAMR